MRVVCKYCVKQKSILLLSLNFGFPTQKLLYIKVEAGDKWVQFIYSSNGGLSKGLINFITSKVFSWFRVRKLFRRVDYFCRISFFSAVAKLANCHIPV